MFAKLKKARMVGVATALVALGALFFASGASAANHSGEYAEFNNCPSTTPGVAKCLYSVTKSGEVVLGKKRVPIVNPVILQAGVTTPNEITGDAHLVAATNGVTLSKSPQPVPGGLTGLVNCKEISNVLLRLSCEATLENGVTGVNATVELARPASEAEINELFIILGENSPNLGLKLPVKIHLENPFLGSSCYVGSSSTPIIWNLVTGKTSPPPPNKSISGTPGTIETKGNDEGILRLNGIRLVDNAWSAPGASGCGGPVAELLLNPIINASVGVPSPAGKNTTILAGVTDDANAESVNAH